VDPDACYRRWVDAKFPSERREAWHDLKRWLDRGGFEPAWTALQKRNFLKAAE
jgi:hypothetical protein